MMPGVEGKGRGEVGVEERSEMGWELGESVM